MNDERMSPAEVEAVLARIETDLADVRERVMGHQPLIGADDLVQAAIKRGDELAGEGRRSRRVEGADREGTTPCRARRDVRGDRAARGRGCRARGGSHCRQQGAPEGTQA